MNIRMNEMANNKIRKSRRMTTLNASRSRWLICLLLGNDDAGILLTGIYFKKPGRTGESLALSTSNSLAKYGPNLTNQPRKPN